VKSLQFALVINEVVFVPKIMDIRAELLELFIDVSGVYFSAPPGTSIGCGIKNNPL